MRLASPLVPALLAATLLVAPDLAITFSNESGQLLNFSSKSGGSPSSSILRMQAHSGRACLPNISITAAIASRRRLLSERLPCHK